MRWLASLLLFASACSLQAETRFAVQQGRKVAYEAVGQGPVLVLVHGWTCDKSFWRLQTPDFARDHRVIALDLPGHGESEPPASALTHIVMGEAIDAVMRAEKVSTATLMGHSMGGGVIRAFERLHPEKVAGLVFVDAVFFPAAKNVEDEKRLRDLGALLSKMAGETPESHRKFVTNMLPASLPPALSEEILTKMLKAPDTTARAAMESMGDPAMHAATVVNQPSLVINANPPSPRTYDELGLRAFLKRLDYQSWNGVSHFLMMEQPVRFNLTVRGWLQQHGL